MVTDYKSSLRAQVSTVEWEVRVDLAAAYRLAALKGWADGTATHISARVPEEENFLINPHGLLFEEVTASNLVKVDLGGNIVGEAGYPINPAGFVVHSAIHEAREDAGCVIHLHTANGVALSCLDCGLLPISQTAMLIVDEVGYHDYEGVAVDLDERARLAQNLGERSILILRNHGMLTMGANVAEAFVRMTMLENASAIQLKVLATGSGISPIAPSAAAKTALVGKRIAGPAALRDWAAFRRQLDRHSTDYKM